MECCYFDPPQVKDDPVYYKIIWFFFELLQQWKIYKLLISLISKFVFNIFLEGSRLKFYYLPSIGCFISNLFFVDDFPLKKITTWFGSNVKFCTNYHRSFLILAPPKNIWILKSNIRIDWQIICILCLETKKFYQLVWTIQNL